MGKITIYWVRQGLFCASNIYMSVHDIDTKPYFTISGIECDKKKANINRNNIDFIFCSPLARSIKTTFESFSDIISNTIPKKIITNSYLGSIKMSQDYHIQNHIKSYNKYVHLDKNKNYANIKLFFKSLDSTLSQYKPKKNYHIIVVSHAHFMKKHNICDFDSKNKKINPKNNSIFKVNYNFSQNNSISKLYQKHTKKNIAKNIYKGCYHTKPYTKNHCKQTKKYKSKN